MNKNIYMNRTTLEAMISMLNAASKDETGYHLCHVKVSNPKGNNIKVEATDGYIMARIILDDPKAIESGLFSAESKELFLNKTQIAMLKVELRSQSRYNEVCLIQAFNWHLSDVQSYPRLDQFIPVNISKEKYEGSIGLDLSLLNKVEKVFNPFKKTCVGKFELGDKLSPIKVTFESDYFLEGFAVVMPCRV